MNSGTGYRSHWYLQHFRIDPSAVIQKVGAIKQKLCSGTGSACPTHLHFEYCWHKLSESEVFTTLLSHNWRSFGVTLGGRSKNPRGSRGARGSNSKTPGGIHEVASTRSRPRGHVEHAGAQAAHCCRARTWRRTAARTGTLATTRAWAS